MSDPAVQINFGGNSGEALADLQRLDAEMVQFGKHATRAANALLLVDLHLRSLRGSPMGQLLRDTNSFAASVQNKALSSVKQLNAEMNKVSEGSGSGGGIDFGGGGKDGGGGKGGGLRQSFMRGVGEAAGAIGLTGGIAGMVVASKNLVQTTLDYKDALAGAAAVGGFTIGSQQYIEVANAARKAGAETRFSATDAANALRELVAAGYSSSQSITALNDVLNLAIAGEVDMATASGFMVNGLNMFKMPVTEATKLLDILATGANASTASVKDLADGLVFVGPNAAALNISLEDTVAMMSVLDNAGVKAGMAGRGLSAIFAKTLNPASGGELAEELASLGYTLNEINPAAVGVRTAFETLSKLKPATLAQLFGIENFDVSNVLTQIDKVDEMQAKFKNTSGAGATFAKTRGDTGIGDIAELQSAIEEAQLTIGDMIEEPLRQWLVEITAYIRDNTDAFKELFNTAINIVQALEHIIKLYVGYKAVTLGITAAVWIAQNAAIIRNTALLIANAAARRQMMVAATAGLNSGLLTQVLTSSVGQAFSGGGVVSAVKSSAASLGLVFGTAIAAWQLGSALEKALDISGRVDKLLNEGMDAAQKAGGESIASIDLAIKTATTPKELADAKAKGADMASAMEKQAMDVLKNASTFDILSGAAQREADTLTQDAAILRQKIRLAEAINAKAKAQQADNEASKKAAEIAEQERKSLKTPEQLEKEAKEKKENDKFNRDWQKKQDELIADRERKRNDLMDENALAKAKIAGDDTEVKRIQDEIDLLKEKRRVAEALGLDLTKREDDIFAEGIAKDFVDAAKIKDNVEQTFGEAVSSSRAIGGGGGYYFAGMGEDAGVAQQKKSNDLLKEAVTELKKISKKGSGKISANVS